jgi:hypothetical protein
MGEVHILTPEEFRRLGLSGTDLDRAETVDLVVGRPKTDA